MIHARTIRNLVLVNAVAFSGCAGSPSLELCQQFQAAQATFDRAQTPDEFLRAAAMYQELLDGGFISGAVLYNQGNAFLRAGQRGRAIAAYRQAQRYRPRDPYLDHNLRSALNAPVVAARPLIEYLLFWQDWVSYGGKFRWFAGLGVVTFAVAVAALYVPRRRWLNAVAAAGLASTLILGLSTGYDWYRFTALRHGVVVAHEAVARKGNADSYEPAFTQPLAEGAEVEIREERGDWLLVRLPGAKEGWLRREQLVVY